MKKRKSLHKKRSSKKVSPRKSIRTFTTVVILSSILLLALNIPITKALTFSPQNQSVLGEGEEKKEEHKEEKQEEKRNEEEKKAEEQRNEEQKKVEESQRESQNNNPPTTNTTIQSTNNLPSKIKTRTEATISSYKIRSETEGNKRETEIEALDGQKIKTKIEDDGVTKIEVEDKGLKLKYIVENGQSRLKIENEEGEVNDATEDELQELHDALEQELEDEDIHIATEDGAIKFRKKNVTAESRFPLSVNIETKQLVVTTPNGQKVVAVLPDQAIDNLLATGVISKIEGEATPGAMLEANLKLEEKNNEVVYRVKGVKNKKLFGFLPVSTPVTAFVSAESGIPVATEQSLLSTLIDTFSR